MYRITIKKLLKTTEAKSLIKDLAHYMGGEYSSEDDVYSNYDFLELISEFPVYANLKNVNSSRALSKEIRKYLNNSGYDLDSKRISLELSEIIYDLYLNTFESMPDNWEMGFGIFSHYTFDAMGGVNDVIRDLEKELIKSYLIMMGF